MNKQKGFAPIILILLAITVIVGAGHFIFRDKLMGLHKQSSIENSSQWTTSKDIAATSKYDWSKVKTVDSSSWKTYTNTKYKYSFKYPATWGDRCTYDSPPASPTENYPCFPVSTPTEPVGGVGDGVVVEVRDWKWSNLEQYIKEELQDEGFSEAQIVDTATSFKGPSGAIIVDGLEGVGGGPSMYVVRNDKLLQLGGSTNEGELTKDTLLTIFNNFTFSE